MTRRPSSATRCLVTPAALLLAVGAAAVSPSAAAAPTTDLYVSPSGRDASTGTSADPLRTLQEALNIAEAGTTIHLAPGVYEGPVSTVRDGRPDAPIRIVGPETGWDLAGRRIATLTGGGRLVRINHSHLELRGFTLDGQPKLANLPWPTGDIAEAIEWRQVHQSDIEDGRLVYIGADDTTDGITGVRISDMNLRGAGGECVRIRNNAHGNIVEGTRIEWCGMHAKATSKGKWAWHNGEGIYIGTSPVSTDQPMAGRDASTANWAWRVFIDTRGGSECWNTKEMSSGNYLSESVCMGNSEPARLNGAAIEMRGPNNTVVGTWILDPAGTGIKVRSDDDVKYPVNGNQTLANVVLAPEAGTAQ